MIAGIFHPGSGVGNQLHRYVATRCLAADKGLPFGMIHPNGFKGASFMKLDMGEPVLGHWLEAPGGRLIPQNNLKTYNELQVLNGPTDIRGYDPEINFVEDNTVIDGEFQDERYFAHHLSEIDKWLHVEPLYIPDDTCVIGFRGGEFAGIPELFLPKEYWDKAITQMRLINPEMRFEVHTDDARTAKKFFPNYPIIQNVEINWRSMRYARHAIIANSSFYIFPRLIRGIWMGKTIAPRYWARRNTKQWALPQNFYNAFSYI